MNDFSFAPLDSKSKKDWRDSVIWWANAHEKLHKRHQELRKENNRLRSSLREKIPQLENKYKRLLEHYEEELNNATCKGV